MKIYYSPASPYVRKCMVVAAELGLLDRIERLPSAASPVKMDMTVAQSNPLGKVPTFITDAGQAIYDSRVICEYLNDLGKGNLIPPPSEQRWRVLTEQSLADGILDAALLARYETATRPRALHWQDWHQGQMRKIDGSLASFEGVIAQRDDEVNVGMIALGCALGYLDFRFPEYDWRGGHPALDRWYARFAERPSMQSTAPRS